MKRGKPLKRRSPLRAKGKRTKKSGGHLFPKGRHAAYLAWLRERPCVVCERQWRKQEFPTQAAHVRSRGAGGADLGNAVSLCVRHHHDQHTLGTKTFEQTYAISMADCAARQTLAFLEEES